MEKQFDPAAIEAACYRRWEQDGRFAPDMAQAQVADQDAFCIMIPPPNVTGTLHMGHGLTMTIQDILTRYHRMQGKPTLWQPGTDHAGIATQMIVERQLEAEGKTRNDLGRDAFIERVWKWKEESGGTITRQLRRLGASPDWSRERFTMDEGLSKAVQATFIRLHRDGLIYKGTRLVNWDPVLKTALSDLEVNSEAESGHLWHLRYPITGSDQYLVVATTRPETMLGDSAVAVHPDDERYQHLIGQSITLPIVGREVPIIADDYVDAEFGSGCVKITPAHDFNDYEMGKRHDLPMLNIFTEDASINDSAPEAYRGLDRYEARKRIVAEFDALGLLESVAPHQLRAPRSDRSNAIVEPLLTEQWYVDLTRETQDDGRPGGWTAIIKPALDVVRDGRVKFHPESGAKTYFQWLENIQDWCISRQIWWGHRVPAWYDEAGNCYVGESEAAVRAEHHLGDAPLTQDTDVLDTWFSSALWPFSTLGWPEQTPELKTFYPTSVLVTGHDILFFWVARMIMAGVYLMPDVPFRDVYLHGLVRDAEGKKMSKSKGNVLDPIDLIDGIDLESLLAKRTSSMMQPRMAERIAAQTRKAYPDGIEAYGTDAVRFTFAASTTTGRDISFDTQRVAGYRNFCNKLWNATRFALMQCEEQDCGIDGDVTLSPVDRWIRTQLQHTETTVRGHLDQYRFDLAAKALYEFSWNTYCDWYLELIKPILQGDDELAKRGTRRTLLRVLEATLRLLHPIMPYITETLWQRVAPVAGIAGESIMQRPYPTPDPALIDNAASADVEWLRQLIMAVRKIRSEMDIAPGKPLDILLTGGQELDRQRSLDCAAILNNVARLASIEWIDNASDAPESATEVIGDLQLMIPLAGLIDKDAELARLDKEIAKLDKEAQSLRGRLSNEAFVAKAPAHIVEQQRARLAELDASAERMQAEQARIQAL